MLPDYEPYLDEIERSMRKQQQVQQDMNKKAEPEFYGENGRFLHNIMGDYLIENYGVCKINEAVHIYKDGIYQPGEGALHGLMIELIPSLSDSRRREVFKYIKACWKTPVKDLSPPNLIPFRHKIYNLNTKEFLDYSKEYIFLNRFPWDYNPDAPECSTVTDTIYTIADGDAEVVKLLLETFGYCFYMQNQYRGAVILYGPSGNNGKSTLLNMLKQLVGAENASFLSLQDTAERFRLIGVYGKAVNIGDDIPSTYIPDSSLFKKLVTGEAVICMKISNALPLRIRIIGFMIGWVKGWTLKNLG